MADIEKVKQGLKQHHAGICTEKYGTICPYWECEASCSKELMADALSVIEGLQTEIERLKPRKAHWITKTCDALYCSNCDAPSICYQPYCCRCGAEMEKDGDGDGNHS